MCRIQNTTYGHGILTRRGTRVREEEGERVGSLELHLRDQREWQEIVTSMPEFFGFSLLLDKGLYAKRG